MVFERAMVFAAHADDEIAMGGTMARMAEEGTRVIVVQMTDGCEGYPRVDMKDKIVAMRREEAEACNRVLGIAKRYYLDRPDMGLVNDKPTLQEVIKIIRAERPDAIFLQGGAGIHRDHINTFNISLEALWHAGQPVAAILGESYRTPEVYIYKGAVTDKPPFKVDVTGYAHKVHEARATQVSQHTLFGGGRGMRTPEEFMATAERVKKEAGPHYESHWIAREVLGHSFLPETSAHRLPNWGPPNKERDK